MKYWYYTYTWELDNSRVPADGAFSGEFGDLVRFFREQREDWHMTFAKEVSAAEFKIIDKYAG